MFQRQPIMGTNYRKAMRTWFVIKNFIDVATTFQPHVNYGTESVRTIIPLLFDF